jgi:hypothetical protein
LVGTHVIGKVIDVCTYSRFVNSCIQLISTGRLTHYGAHTPRLLRSNLLRVLELVLRHGFLLDRLPAVIHSKRSYPAMPLAGQLANQRFTIPGPLVQRNDSLNSLSLLVQDNVMYFINLIGFANSIQIFN